MRAVDNDEAKFLIGRRADDGGVVIGSHCATVLGTDRVRRLEDGIRYRWVVVRQPDYKVVQTICCIHCVHRYGLVVHTSCVEIKTHY